jgi:hypothetical protein
LGNLTQSTTELAFFCIIWRWCGSMTWKMEWTIQWAA